VVASSGSTNISIGDSAGGAATLLNTFGITTAVGRYYPATEAGGTLAWSDTGSTDIKLTVTNSASTSAGSLRFTILYQQNNNLS